MIETFGVKGAQVEELYALDADLLGQLKYFPFPLHDHYFIFSLKANCLFCCCRPVYGLIFLFKWVADKEQRGTPVDPSNVFFARQVITNACATQALLNILFNCNDVHLGAELDSFKQLTQDFNSEVPCSCRLSSLDE